MRLPRACRKAATLCESRALSGEQPTTAQVVNCSRICCASSLTRRRRLRRRSGLLLELLVGALAELLHDLLAEGREVVRLARGGEAAVHVDLLVDPRSTGILEVGLEGRPRRERQALGDACVDQRPRAMADGANRLARLEERADEAADVVVDPQEVRVRNSARQHQPGVVPRVGVRDLLVHVELLAVVEMLEALDLAVLE